MVPGADDGNFEEKGASISVPANDDADEVETTTDIVKKHTSEVTNNMTGLVFKDVSALFLLVSFLMAMNMCWVGLQQLAFTPALTFSLVAEGIEVHLVAG